MYGWTKQNVKQIMSPLAELFHYKMVIHSYWNSAKECAALVRCSPHGETDVQSGTTVLGSLILNQNLEHSLATEGERHLLIE